MDRIVSIIAVVLFAVSILLQAQPVAPYGVTQASAGESLIIYWFYPAINETTLAVVDDEPQSYLLYGDVDVGARLATVFDLPDQLCGIEAIELRLWPNDPFPQLPGDASSLFGLAVDTSLCGDTMNVPIWRREVTNASPGQGAWLHFPVRKCINADSLVVEFRWLSGTPTAPLPAVVFSAQFINSYLGFVNNGLVEWSKVHGETALVRVQVNLADVDSGRMRGAAPPDSFSVFIFDAPGQSRFDSAAVVTISDSMHVVVNRADVEGKSVAVAAWQEGVLGPKSEIVQIDVSTEVDESVLPLEAGALEQNFPNPFNAGTTIHSRRGEEIVIYDILGRRVCRLQAEYQSTDGVCRFEWNGRNDFGVSVPSGVYFYRQPGHLEIKKLVLLK